MKYTAGRLYLALIYVLLYLPLAILILYSFNDMMFSSQWRGFTLKWYQALLEDHELLVIVIHSLTIAICAATMAVILGTFTAILLSYYHFRGKQILFSTIFTLIIFPDIVLAVALLMLFHFMHIALGFWTLLLAHITFCIPFVVFTMLSRLNDIDKTLFSAAKDLGATEPMIIKKVLLPLLWPAIIASWLLSFSLSVDDVIISFFVTGPSFEILPLYIFSMVRLGVKPEINALCTFIFCATLLLVVISQLMMKKK